MRPPLPSSISSMYAPVGPLHDPRGVLCRVPLSPLPEQPAMLYGPAPTSEVTTPMWTLGRPPSMFSRTLMKRWKLLASDVCSSIIEPELSTMNRMSMLRFSDTGMLVWPSLVGRGSTWATVWSAQPAARAAPSSPVVKRVALPLIRIRASCVATTRLVQGYCQSAATRFQTVSPAGRGIEPPVLAQTPTSLATPLPSLRPHGRGDAILARLSRPDQRTSPVGQQQSATTRRPCGGRRTRIRRPGVRRATIFRARFSRGRGIFRP